MIDFATVLRKMIEKMGDDSPTRRATLYAAARRTIDRYVDIKAISPSEATRERMRLDKAIEAMEAAYIVPKNLSAADRPDFRDIFSELAAFSSSRTIDRTLTTRAFLGIGPAPSEFSTSVTPLAEMPTAPAADEDKAGWQAVPKAIAEIFAPAEPTPVPDETDSAEIPDRADLSEEASSPPIVSDAAATGDGRAEWLASPSAIAEIFAPVEPIPTRDETHSAEVADHADHVEETPSSPDGPEACAVREDNAGWQVTSAAIAEIFAPAEPTPVPDETDSAEFPDRAGLPEKAASSPDGPEARASGVEEVGRLGGPAATTEIFGPLQSISVPDEAYPIEIPDRADLSEEARSSREGPEEPVAGEGQSGWLADITAIAGVFELIEPTPIPDETHPLEIPDRPKEAPGRPEAPLVGDEEVGRLASSEARPETGVAIDAMPIEDEASLAHGRKIDRLTNEHHSSVWVRDGQGFESDRGYPDAVSDSGASDIAARNPDGAAAYPDDITRKSDQDRFMPPPIDIAAPVAAPGSMRSVARSFEPAIPLASPAGVKDVDTALGDVEITEVLTFARTMLSEGLVPFDGSWVTSTERREGLRRAAVSATRLTFQAGLAIAVIVAAACLIIFLLLAIAY